METSASFEARYAPSSYPTKYHIVWVTKYRFAILGGDVGQRCRELVRETARAHEMVIHAGSINRDHVHLLVSTEPVCVAGRPISKGA